MYRQGDILVVPIEEATVPPGTDRLPRQPRGTPGEGSCGRSVRSPDMPHAVVGPGPWSGTQGRSVPPASILRTAGGWCTRSTRRYRCRRAGTGWCARPSALRFREAIDAGHPAAVKALLEALIHEIRVEDRSATVPVFGLPDLTRSPTGGRAFAQCPLRCSPARLEPAAKRCWEALGG